MQVTIRRMQTPIDLSNLRSHEFSTWIKNHVSIKFSVAFASTFSSLMLLYSFKLKDSKSENNRD